MHQLIRRLSQEEREPRRLGNKAWEQDRDRSRARLRLYSLSERKKRSDEALSYNALVQSWPEIIRLAQEGGRPKEKVGELFGEEEI